MIFLEIFLGKEFGTEAFFSGLVRGLFSWGFLLSMGGISQIGKDLVQPVLLVRTFW